MENQKPDFYTLFQKVGGIEGRLDTIEKGLNKITENHEKRINEVEKITDQFIGKASIVGTITGFVGGIIVSLIAPFFKR